MEEFFPQNENLKTVLCRPSVEKSQNCEIFFWGYDGRTITRAEFTGMKNQVLVNEIYEESGAPSRSQVNTIRGILTSM